METVKFKNLFNFNKKSSLKASENEENGKYPFYTSSSNISKKTNKPLYSEKSLVIGNGGSANIHYADIPFSTTSHCYIATAKNNNLNIKYVFYYLFSNIHILERGFKGAGLKNISSKYIDEIDIPFPNLETQDKIVAILDKAKNLIEKREQTIKMFDELLSATFLDIFGDPFFNPKNWIVDKLENYLEFIGDIGSHGSNALISKNLKMLDEKNYAIMIRTVNLSKGNFENNLKYSSKETYEFFYKTKIYGGEIIMNKIGSAGDFWLMPKLNTPVTLGLNQLVIKPNSNLENLYLFHFLSSDYGRSIVKSKIRGATTKSITKGAVKALDIIVPPINLQQKFSKIVLKIESSKEKLIQSKTQLENLLNGLSQQAFSGKILYDINVELDALLNSINLELTDEHNNINTIKNDVIFIQRLIDKFNEHDFEDKNQYDKAKYIIFRIMKEEEDLIKQIFKNEKVQLTLQNETA